jgi:hypothetical protein
VNTGNDWQLDAGRISTADHELSCAPAFTAVATSPVAVVSQSITMFNTGNHAPSFAEHMAFARSASSATASPAGQSHRSSGLTTTYMCAPLTPDDLPAVQSRLHCGKEQASELWFHRICNEACEVVGRLSAVCSGLHFKVLSAGLGPLSEWPLMSSLAGALRLVSDLPGLRSQ